VPYITRTIGSVQSTIGDPHSNAGKAVSRRIGDGLGGSWEGDPRAPAAGGTLERLLRKLIAN